MLALTRFNSIYRFIPSKARFFCPTSQKATSGNPWMSARRVSSEDLAKEDTLWRVAPDEACGGCHGRKPVGLHSTWALSQPGPIM